jgi:hypothetical protein
MRKKNDTEQFLDTVLNERQEIYGDARDNFEAIGLLWSVLLKTQEPLTEYDYALAMIVMKADRARKNPFHKDNWVDIIGYAKLALEMLEQNE